MTGNVVLLGVALGQGRADDAARSIFVLAVFILGVALGVRLGSAVAPIDWARLSARLIGLEKIALLLFALGWTFLPRTNEAGVYALLVLLAAAMGLQTAALAKLGAPGVGTTAITGTITALVTGLVSLAVPDSGETSSSRLRFQAGVLALYCLGAAINGFLLINLPWLAGCVPIAAAVWVWPWPRKA